MKQTHKSNLRLLPVTWQICNANFSSEIKRGRHAQQSEARFLITTLQAYRAAHFL